MHGRRSDGGAGRAFCPLVRAREDGRHDGHAAGAANGLRCLRGVDPKSPTLSWDDLVSATTAAADSWTQASGGCGGGFRLEVAKATTSESFGAEGTA